MANLSDLPTQWDEPDLAVDTLPGGLDEPATPFLWPAPAVAGYGSGGESVQGMPCEVEGLNGRIMPGRLVAFEPDAGELQLLMRGSRKAVTLRFEHFRRLTLLVPLRPREPAGWTREVDPQAQGPLTTYRLLGVDGHVVEGLTLPPLEDACGAFLYEPLDLRGQVRRRFVPRSAYETLETGDDRPASDDLSGEDGMEAAVREQEQLRRQRVGEMLAAQEVATPAQLEQAIQLQSRMPSVRIGEALMALGFATQAVLDEALARQQSDRGVPLGELLVQLGHVTRDQLQLALSRKMGYPLVDVQRFEPDAEALGRVPHHLASRHGALPLAMRGGRLVVALDDPARQKALHELEFAAQTGLIPVLARHDLLPAAINRAYDRVGLGSQDPSSDPLTFTVDEPSPGSASELLASLEQQSGVEQRAGDEPQIEQSDNSLVRLIHTMILQAQAQGISDIHVECPPGRDKVRIRFRKDGLLRPYLELPHTYRQAVIARLKIMCDLDISERRKPQDGKIAFGKFHAGSRLELRLATIPTFGGCEDAVLRLLANARTLPLDQLGLSAANLAGVREIVERPYGMFLCVGPTGSGKTTTLHSAMGQINTPARKIWTAEDPIEITQAGLRQVQVNPKIDWTFARALRAFLRADPDVVMVGEIRDAETAQVAIEASLTGHLVLSTLHTNSAAETVTRLLDMGMDPFNFADALLGVLAQRLVRRLCPHCRTAEPMSADQQHQLLEMHRRAWPEGAEPEDEAAVVSGWVGRHGKDGRLMHHHSPGCGDCDQTGYRGRVALHELLTVSRETRRLVQTGERAERLLAQAMSEGMRTLRQDGIEKVLAGQTSIEEVRASSNN